MLGKNREKKKTFCPKSSILTHFWPFFAQKRPFLTILPPTPPTPLFSSFRTRRILTRARARVTGCSGPLCRFSTQRFRRANRKIFFRNQKVKSFVLDKFKNKFINNCLHGTLRVASDQIFLYCVSKKGQFGLANRSETC